MRPPHLLRVEEGPERFAPLLAAMAAAGLRAGWLELRPPEPAPASLEAAAALGARRAVAVGGGRSVALKAMRGGAVLRDLLREHFSGCSLVLVLAPREPAPGAAPLQAVPTLIPLSGSWRVSEFGDAAAQHFDTPGLMARLRRPHPWNVGPAGASED